MADLILGQPSNLTTVTAGTGGRVRVTYAPWELDWEWFNTIAIGNWLANTTTATSTAITAKGGQENLGYWFEINQAFPSANWNTGDRIAPQRQAAIAQFASFFLATLAMANDDMFLIWYADTANRRTWYEGISWVDEGGSAWGMLSRQQIALCPSADNANCVFMGGNLNGLASQMEVVNLRISSAGGYGLRYASLAIQPQGPGFFLRRCKIQAALSGVYIDRCDAGTCVIGNCTFKACLNGVQLTASASEVWIVCNLATGTFLAWASLPNTVVIFDDVDSECRQISSGVGSLNLVCCASTLAILAPSPTNIGNQDARANLRFFHDLARPGDKAFDYDFRIHYDSVLRGRGQLTGLAPLDWDSDGRLRPDPPAIGPYEPMGTCYAPAASLVQGATKRGVRS